MRTILANAQLHLCPTDHARCDTGNARRQPKPIGTGSGNRHQLRHAVASRRASPPFHRSRCRQDRTDQGCLGSRLRARCSTPFAHDEATPPAANCCWPIKPAPNMTRTICQPTGLATCAARCTFRYGRLCQPVERSLWHRITRGDLGTDHHANHLRRHPRPLSSRWIALVCGQ